MVNNTSFPERGQESEKFKKKKKKKNRIEHARNLHAVNVFLKVR